MLQKNIIGKLVFDIRFDSDTDAFSREESLESFTCNRLMPVVDEVLDLHSANGALIPIGSLEIDLGDLSHEDFREKMPECLKERLDAAMREKIRSLKGSPSRQEGVFSRREANYRLIEHFLSTGTLPWAMDLKTDLSLSRLLQDVLASDGRRLADFLKRSGTEARKRLVRQFPAQDFIALVHLLAPDHYQFVIDTVEAIDQLQQKTAFMPAGRGVAVLLTWDLVFDYLSDRDGERFSPDDFAVRVISDLAAAAGTDTTGLLRDLSTASLEVDMASERRSDLHTLLTALTGDEAGGGNEGRIEAFERLKDVLVNMLEFGATSGFDIAWGDLLIYYPDLISTVIREHGKKSEVRKRIATSFSDAQIQEVIRLIEPENSAFIETFADQSALIADDERVRPSDRSVHRKQIWESVLTYLLVERGCRFNEKAFTGSVIRQLAAHYNWTYRQLLTSLREAIEAAQPPGPMKDRSLGIVTELEGELTTERQLRKEPAPESRRQIRGADLYAFLELHLMGEAVHEMIPDDPLSALAGRTVRELQRDYPQVLLRLLKALQIQPDAIRRITTRLSVEQLQQFVTAFLALVLSPKKGRHEELYTAIARWADRAADKRRYFADVLDAVIRGKRIDLETVVEGTQKHSVLEPVSRVVAESADPDLTASYLTWFLTVPPVDHQERTLYRSLLERFMIDFPEAFGWYLTGMVKEPSRLAVFVRLTPWRLIRDAVAAVAGFTDVMRYVAILERVFRPGIPSPTCQPADFVRIVIDVLSEQGHSDGQTFFKTAFRRLLVHTGDSTTRERAVDTLKRIVSAKGVRAPVGLRSVAAQYGHAWDLVPTGDKAITDTRVPKEADVLVYLKGDLPTLPASLATLKGALEAMIFQTPDKLYQFIAAHLDHSNMGEKLTALVSEPFLARLLHLLIPRNYSRAQRYVDLLRNAAYGVGVSDSSDKVGRLIWEGVFIYLRETGLRVFDEGAFVRRMIEFLAAKKNMDRPTFYADFSQQLAANIQPSTRSDSQVLIRIVSEAAQEFGRSETSSSELQAQPPQTISLLKKDQVETAWAEEIYVTNAGMVIAAPYLPRLFELLKLTEKSRFKSREAAERGVHLLQYMVDERTSTPEYQLVLNKLLCGVKPGIPIVRGVEITEEETEAITGLITAMIQNWKIIGNTSAAGFRESFLQREGRLGRKEDAWHLQVEQRAFDMLLDQIPWSFSTIKYSWMDRVIFVQWRE